MCKSIQHDIVPPLQSFERINPLVNSTSHLQIASKPTSLMPSAVLAVSSAGLGGVNGHCVLTYPPEGSRRKALGDFLPHKRFNRKKLDSPHKVHRQVADTFFEAQKVISLCASYILGLEVNNDTNLHDAGLDSASQVRLIRMLLDFYNGPALRYAHIPFSAKPQPFNLILHLSSITAISRRDCTPETLAASLRRGVATSPSLPFYASVLQSGDGINIYVLIAPGGGSCASYSDLVRSLPHYATILGVEHPKFVRPSSETLRYSVEDLASLYVAVLEQYSQKINKCVLVGASFGGVVAVEMAKRLSSREITVSSLVLLDSPIPGSSSAAEKDLSMGSFLKNVYNVHYTDLTFWTNGTASAFNITQLETFLTTAAARDPALIDSIIKSDWKTLAKVYSENVSALMGYSVDGVSIEIPALYIHAGAEGLSTPWTNVLSCLSVGYIDAPHALIYSGDHAERVADMIAKML